MRFFPCLVRKTRLRHDTPLIAPCAGVWIAKTSGNLKSKLRTMLEYRDFHYEESAIPLRDAGDAGDCRHTHNLKFYVISSVLFLSCHIHLKRVCSAYLHIANCSRPNNILVGLLNGRWEGKTHPSLPCLGYPNISLSLRQVAPRLYLPVTGEILLDIKPSVYHDTYKCDLKVK